MSLLSQQIERANCLDGLNAVLRHIPLDAVRSFAHNEYLKMNKEQQAVIQSKMLNPNKIFPDDLIQNILSFEYCSQTRTVCKLWKSVTHKIENNQQKLRKEIIRTRTKGFDDEIIRMMPAVNRTFVVDQSRATLAEEELEKGYLRPYSNPQELFRNGELEDADQILIHSGTYIMDPVVIWSQIRIIGVGSEVILKHSGHVEMGVGMPVTDSFIDLIGARMYIENIQIHCRGSNENLYECVTCACGRKRDGYVLMKNCALFTSVMAMRIRDLVHFQALNCRFCSGFKIETTSDIVLIGCDFRSDPDEDWRFTGDWLTWQCYQEEGLEINHCSKIECIGNCFELDVTMDELMYPFCIRHGLGGDHKGDQCTAPAFHLADNMVTSMYQNDNIVDGNTMYRFWGDEEDEDARTMIAVQSAE